MSTGPYLASLGVGLAIGAIYGLLAVKSPAPPIIALLGLLGILIGEGSIRWLKGHTNIVSSCLHEKSFSISPAKDEAEDSKSL